MLYYDLGWGFLEDICWIVIQIISDSKSVFEVPLFLPFNDMCFTLKACQTREGGLLDRSPIKRYEVSQVQEERSNENSWSPRRLSGRTKCSEHPGWALLN
jgi:hypothetical protein